MSLLAIDQGTTSSRAVLFSDKGKVLAVKQKELKLIMPEKGWVEQDPMAIWKDTLACAKHVAKGANVAAIGITNQRETTIIWDKKSGKPVYNAIVWQDRRTADQCVKLKKHEKMIEQKTGLILNPYFSATKIAWILDNVKGARKGAENGELLFGTVDSWLLWNLTGGKVHATDITNASRTMIFNIIEEKWDEKLLKLFNIPSSLLPEVKENVANFGSTSLLGKKITIGGMAGDQHAALIGQACFKPGMVKSTYGTGCFALMNSGKDFKASRNGLLTTVGYKINGTKHYAIEGSIFMAGALIQWLRDNLGFFKDAANSEAFATSVSDNGGVYLVPAFAGLGAPYWEPKAQGMITGLSRDSTKAHIARAALEAQAYQTLDLIGAMEADSGMKIKTMRADGGLVRNNFMCQFLSDMLGRDIELPVSTEATAWGAAALAGLQAGIFKKPDDIAKIWTSQKVYKSKMKSPEREKLYKGWKAAIKKVLA